MNDELGALLELLSILLTHPVTGVLIALLVLAAVIDWRTMRIPNWLTVSGMVYALAMHVIRTPSAWDGLIHASSGLAIGLFVLLPLWVIRVLGAGDVKLMAMVGAFLGPVAVLQALTLVLVIGGACAIAFAVAHHAVGQLAANVRTMAQTFLWRGATTFRPERSGTSIGRLPYGLSIALGTFTFLVARQLGFI